MVGYISSLTPILHLSTSCWNQSRILVLPQGKCCISKGRSSYTLSYQIDSGSSKVVRSRSGAPNIRIISKCFLGAVQNVVDAAPISWMSFVDQMLMITTITLAYMAGVLPNRNIYVKGRSGTEGSIFDSEANFPGRYSAQKISSNSTSWIKVERKLLDALDAVSDSCDNSGLIISESHGSIMNHSSSLFALKEGSRLRLLVSTLHGLQKEVLSISSAQGGAQCDGRLAILSNTIKGSVKPIILEWLEGEISFQNNTYQEEIIFEALGKLEANDSILQKIILLTKVHLYGDLLFYLRFASQCTFHYDECIIMQHEVDILEDFVITLADGICSIYLELISVDSSLSSEGNLIKASLCPLSTRDLQKLRNQVALDQWLVQNFDSVISMYEDRFDLFVLKMKPLNEPNTDATNPLNPWKCFLFQQQSPKSYLQYMVFTKFSIFVRRTKELKALTGWRYYYSLFLELSDIAMPLIKAAFVKARNAVSFFLTCLIGRSLGLIYAGIRQSLGWK